MAKPFKTELDYAILRLSDLDTPAGGLLELSQDVKLVLGFGLEIRCDRPVSDGQTVWMLLEDNRSQPLSHPQTGFRYWKAEHKTDFLSFVIGRLTEASTRSAQNKPSNVFSFGQGSKNTL